MIGSSVITKELMEELARASNLNFEIDSKTNTIMFDKLPQHYNNRCHVSFNLEYSYLDPVFFGDKEKQENMSDFNIADVEYDF